MKEYSVRDLALALIKFYPKDISYVEIERILTRVCGTIPEQELILKTTEN